MSRILVLILAVACAWVNGYVVGDSMNKPTRREPPEFPAEQRLSTEWRTARLTEQKVLLNFVSREKLAEISGSEIPEGQSAAGLTLYGRNPCEIFLPDDWGVSYRPGRGQATFNSREDSDTLAHEILHCLVGAWHPKWPVILSNRSSK